MADELSNSLIDSVSADVLKDISADALEYSADAFTDNEAVKAIPFFGTALKVLKGITSYRDFLFMKVIYRFLFAYSSVSDEKRIEFLIRMEDDPNYKSKVGEKLIFILNQVDDIDKAEVLGNLFKAFIEGKFIIEVFTRISAIVNNSFLPDILGYGEKQLKVVYKKHEESQLANSGFLYTMLTEQGMDAAIRNKIYGKRYNTNTRIEAVEQKKTVMKRSLNVYGALILWYGIKINSLKVWIALGEYQQKEPRPEQ